MINDNLVLSGTVTHTRETLQSHPEVSAATVVKTILETHGEYGEYAGYSAEKLTLVESSFHAGYPIDEWLRQVRALYNETLVSKLHGKLVIIGLALLDADLREQLRQQGFLPALIKEVKEKFPDILSEQGRDLYEKAGLGAGEPTSHSTVTSEEDKPVTPPVPPHTPAVQSQVTPPPARRRIENEPILKDNPLTKLEDDQLGRAEFAEYLAARISALSIDGQAFAFHLHAPWGAGKSTLLNFLKKELEKQRQKGTHWVLIDFNAWQHQHISPPWWSLLDRVFHASKSELHFDQIAQEYWWRFSLGRLPHVIALSMMLFLFFMLLPTFKSWVSGETLTADMKQLADIAGYVTGIIAAIAAIWGGLQNTGRSLLLNSAAAAESYSKRTADPMGAITKHFNQLIGWLKPKQVAIFIDDLDRCQSAYAVELLEGIQTLFRGSPVVYIVAADQDWLNTCFQEVYSKFENKVKEPEKLLGMRFLEKVFQFSTPLPNVPDRVKADYWETLFQKNPKQQQEEKLAARQKADVRVQGIETEADIMGMIHEAHPKKLSPIEESAMRQAAVMKLTTGPVADDIQHHLLPYHPLVESNPRTMRRLVNTYNANRAIDIIARVDQDDHQLTLWTILMMRWPRLAHVLCKQPELLTSLSQDKLAKLPAEITDLFKPEDLPAIQRVLKGEIDPEKASHPLQEATLEKCARLYA